MRIVQAKRTAVQSLGRHSVGNTGYEGGSVIAAIGGEIAKAGLERAERLDRRQNQKSNLFMQKEDHQFWEQWGGEEFFDVSDLPSDIVTEGMELEGRISSAQVIPMMYEDHMNRAMENAAKIIDIPNSRDAWLAEKKIIAVGRMTKIQADADKQIGRQILADQTVQRSNALEAGRPDIARIITQDMDISPGQMKEELRIIDVETEVLVYEDIQSFDYIEGSPAGRAANDKQLQEAIDYLSKPQKEYVGSNGNFDSTLKNGWKSELIRTREARKALLKTKDKRGKQDLQYRIDSLQKAATGKLEINDEEFSSVYEDLKNWNATHDNELHKVQLGFEDDMATYIVARKHINQSPGKRRKSLENGYKLFDSPSRNDRANSIIRDIDATFNKGLIDNPMKTLQDSGFFKEAYGATGLSPIDLKADVSQLSDQFRNRLAQYELAAAHNEAIGAGPLESSQEAPRMSALMNSLNAREQQQYITAIQSGMGDKSGLLYGQLALDGSSKTFSIAGDATNAGNLIGSENMLLGMEYYRENSEEYDDVRESIDKKINALILNSYSTKPKKKAAIKESILHGYVGYTKDKKKQTSVDSDLFEQAARDATGGLFEYNGAVFPNPQYGMEDKGMGNWINNISVKYIDRVGAPVGQSAQEFVNDLRAENYKLTATRKSDEYIVSSEGGTPLLNIDGSAYRLKYDSFAERRPDPQYLVDYIKNWMNTDEE